jgi:hypothetical protein
LLRVRLRVACAVAALVCVAMPAALGASMGPVLDLLGAQSEHLCKCGMAPGKCGCPECARSEQQTAREQVPDSVPTLRRHCEEGAPGLTFAALPGATESVGAIAVLPAPAGERTPRDLASRAHADRDDDPPTPPPRIAAA